MKKATQLYLVDTLLALMFLLAGITGIMKMPGWFKIEEIAVPLRFIHDWSGIAMVVLVGIHLIQHWKWIVAMTKRLIIQNEHVRNIFIIIFVIIITTVISLTVYTITSNIKNNSGIIEDIKDTPIENAN